MPNRTAAALAGALLTAGCAFADFVGPPVCPAVISRAIEVEVRDAHTGAPAATGATGVASQGNFRETLQIISWTHHPSPESAVGLGGVEERPGIYTVRVEKPGYLTWERTGVRAEKGVCGVITAKLQAQLEPAPSARP